MPKPGQFTEYNCGICILTNWSHNVLKLMKPIIICETLFNTIELELEKLTPEEMVKCSNSIKKIIKNKSSINENK